MILRSISTTLCAVTNTADSWETLNFSYIPVYSLLPISAYSWKLSISKRHFRPGRMAEPEWTGSVWAVRDTPVADYWAPRINTRHHVAYRPPIAVSPFLLTLSVSCFLWTQRHCGQLWPYFGMGSMGTGLYRDCNAMGDTANISPYVPSTCVENSILSLLTIYLIPCHQIYVGVDNPSLVPSVYCLTTCSYFWNSVRAANDISHSENVQSNGCHCFSHLY